MSDTYLRQWEMLRMIPRLPHKVATSTLAAKLKEKGFEVDLRTVQRDLNTLSRRLPLTSDGANPAGWSWSDRKIFDVPGMDAQTALTFVLAEQFLGSLMPPQSLAYLQPHFVRAHEILKDVANPGLRDWTDKIRVLPRGMKLLPAQTNADVLDAVYAGLLEEKRLDVSYKPKHQRRAKQYEISPLGLVLRDSVTYVVGTLWHYPELMHFALHRMKRASVLDKTCNVPEGFNLDEHIATGEFSYPISERKIKLKALFDKDAAIHLYETPLSDDQKLKKKQDGRVLLSATVMDTQELRWWLLGFGDQVEVLRPAKLRHEFSLTAKKVLRRYLNAAHGDGY